MENNSLTWLEVRDLQTLINSFAEFILAFSNETKTHLQAEIKGPR